MWNFKSSIISLLPTTIQRPLPMSEKGGGGRQSPQGKEMCSLQSFEGFEVYAFAYSNQKKTGSHRNNIMLQCGERMLLK